MKKNTRPKIRPASGQKRADLPPRSRPAPASPRWRAPAAIGLLAAIFYWRTTDYDFTFLDDKTIVLDAQPFLTQLSSVFSAFKTAYLSEYYRPIVTATLVLDAQWSGDKPFGYHATNVVLHAIAACLVVLLLRRLKFGDRVAAFAGALFALHPALVESVAWIPGRNDTLLAVFALGAWLFLARAIERASPRDHLLHVACFALALFTKETALVLPLLFAAHVMLIEERPAWLKSWRPWAAWCGASGVYLWARARVLESSLGDSTERAHAFFRNLSVLVASVGKLALPWHLAPISIRGDAPVWLGFVAGIAVAALTRALPTIRRNVMALGATTVLVPLFPVLLSSDHLTLENRLYLPAVGVAIIVAEIARALRIDERIARAGAGLLLGAAALEGWFYMASFRDRPTFTAAVIAASPRSSLAHLQRGLFIQQIIKDEDGAAREYELAIDADPSERVVHNNYGVILMHRRQLAEAERELRKEIALNPGYSSAYYNLGLVLRMQPRIDEAAAMFESALALNPDNIDAMGELLQIFGPRDPAKATHYREEMEKRGVRFVSGPAPPATP